MVSPNTTLLAPAVARMCTGPGVAPSVTSIWLRPAASVRVEAAPSVALPSSNSHSTAASAIGPLVLAYSTTTGATTVPGGALCASPDTMASVSPTAVPLTTL
jgi:hypothetical protein